MASMLGRFGGWLYQQPYLLICITYVTWAFNIVLGRYVAGHFPPVALSFLRWGDGVPHPAAVRLAVPETRLADDPSPPAADDGARDHRHLRLQHDGLLGPAIYEAINALLTQSTAPLLIALWTFAMFGDRLSRRQVDRHPDFVRGRDRHPVPGRHRSAAIDLVQPRRHLVLLGAGDFRVLFGADEETAGACIRSRSSPFRWDGARSGWHAVTLVGNRAPAARRRPISPALSRSSMSRSFPRSWLTSATTARSN